ncbi:MAG: hypothetical protein ACK53L_31245, partial [Pirellulaceae bacterium]
LPIFSERITGSSSSRTRGRSITTLYPHKRPFLVRTALPKSLRGGTGWLAELGVWHHNRGFPATSPGSSSADSLANHG